MYKDMHIPYTMYFYKLNLCNQHADQEIEYSSTTEAFAMISSSQHLLSEPLAWLDKIIFIYFCILHK